MVMACFNSAATITRAVKSASLLNVSHDIVVVDDCSTDDSEKVLASSEVTKLIKKVIVHPSRRGPAAARNSALAWGAERNYDYITFLDSDDHFLACEISQQLDSGADLYVFESIETADKYADTSSYQDYVLSVNSNQHSDLSEILERYSVQPNKVCTFTTAWAKFFKGSVIYENNIFFNESMHTFEDVDFNFRFLQSHGSLKIVNSPVYAHTRPSVRRLTASFNPTTGFSGLFSFTWAIRSMRRFTNCRFPDLPLNYAGLYSAYFSISLTRAARMVRSVSSFHRFLKFVRSRLCRGYTQRAFGCYDHRQARGRWLLTLLIRRNAPFSLCLYLVGTSVLEQIKERRKWHHLR